MIIFVVTNMTGWLVVIPVPSDNPQPASQRKLEISHGHRTDWPTS